MEKVAIIVETRKHKALPCVINNVMSVLPDDWQLQIFHGTDNFEYINEFISNEKYFEKTTFTNLNIKSITADESSLDIMLTTKFWNQVVADNVLYFECDTMLCTNSKYKIDDYMHHNYIGGWWGFPFDISSLEQTYDRVMNGGVSFRKKEFMLDIIENKLESYLANGGNPCEDYFVSACVTDRPKVKEVLSFSIDSSYMYPLDDNAPFGVHKPWGVPGKENSGQYYTQIKRVCDDVEILEELNNV